MADELGLRLAQLPSSLWCKPSNARIIIRSKAAILAPIPTYGCSGVRLGDEMLVAESSDFPTS